MVRTTQFTGSGGGGFKISAPTPTPGETLSYFTLRSATMIPSLQQTSPKTEAAGLWSLLLFWPRKSRVESSDQDQASRASSVVHGRQSPHRQAPPSWGWVSSRVFLFPQNSAGGKHPVEMCGVGQAEMKVIFMLHGSAPRYIKGLYCRSNSSGTLALCSFCCSCKFQLF